MKRLRYGILVNNLTLQKWQIDALETLEQDGLAELVLIVKKKQDVLSKNAFSRRFDRSFLFKFYNKFYIKNRSPVLKINNISEMFSDVRVMDCEIRKEGKYSEYFSDEDIYQIREEKLDFMIRFGFGIIRGDILECATHGVWSYHHDDERVIRGGPPCFWEMYNSLPTTGSILQRLTDKLDGGRIIRRGTFRTHPYSYTKNMGQAYKETSLWIASAATEILLTEGLKYEEPSELEGPIYKTPSTLEFITFIVKCYCGYLKHLYARLFLIENWNVAVSAGSIENIVKNKNLSQYDFEWFAKLRKDEFIADQFLYEEDERLGCLVEYYHYGQKGKVVEFPNVKINKQEFREVIGGKYHHSFPFIIEQNGDLFCIPESYEANSLNLYKKNKDNWVFVKTIIANKQIIDASFLYHNNRYWIFCGLRDQSPNLKLFIFSSDRLDGDYVAHPLNPVKTDVETARSAGNFILYDEQIYRPAQNYSKTYGGSVFLNKIIRLDEVSFSEEKYTELLPLKDYPDGLHTLSYSKNYIAIDGKKIVWHPLAWWYRLKNKFQIFVK